MERVQIRLWRMAKGVPYGTLLWFDESKELPELFRIPDPVPPADPPLDSVVKSDQLDMYLSVSALEAQ